MKLPRRRLLVTAGAWAAVGLASQRDRLSCAPRGTLRIVTWNLRNFDGRGHDLVRIEELLASVDADILCFQEVLDPQALARLIPGHQYVQSLHGGGHGQYLVTAWRGDIELAGQPISDDGVTVGRALRPALVVPLRARGKTLNLVTVHLKSAPRGHATRRLQWTRLRDLLERTTAPRVVLGDFNTTGPGPAAASDRKEITALEDLLRPVGLVRARPHLPCSAYWEGHRFDRWKVPSTLDHIFVEISGHQDAPTLHPAPGTPCDRHACEPFISTAAYPDREYEGVSDHCPLYVDWRPSAVGSRG